MSAGLLARLLAGLLTGAALKSAAEALGAPFALETFYRLRQRLRRRLEVVRTRLCRERKSLPSGQVDPLLHTLEHLHAVFPTSGAIAAFQLRFQRPLLG